MLQALSVDSYALLAIAQNEPSASTVRARLREAERAERSLYLTTINLGEVAYKVEQRYGAVQRDTVLAAVDALPIGIVETDRRLALAAASIKAVYGIGYAEAFVAALAREVEGAVLTGDPDFRKVEPGIAVEWLEQA